MTNRPELLDESEIETIVSQSFQAPVLIFKHSTRCSISSMALNRLTGNSEPVDFYYLDVIANRNISNLLASRFSVHHESPQVLMIVKGECVYEASHLEITSAEIAAQRAMFG